MPRSGSGSDSDHEDEGESATSMRCKRPAPTSRSLRRAPPRTSSSSPVSTLTRRRAALTNSAASSPPHSARRSSVPCRGMSFGCAILIQGGCSARTSYRLPRSSRIDPTPTAKFEPYCSHLRQRDKSMKDYADAAALHTLEATKWDHEHGRYEERLAHAAGELAVEQQAHVLLDEQKLSSTRTCRRIFGFPPVKPLIPRHLLRRFQYHYCPHSQHHYFPRYQPGLPFPLIRSQLFSHRRLTRLFQLESVTQLAHLQIPPIQR
ncbi:hypothetical protein BV22DRAFT_135413 [Leucogyrophana mollusca]|uniref:Uncharacterized protein n=1 Tax=Leucogyrophana mollusca TaxID=85980 RepID=A0ACB8BU07_9AGAM|nr:hypothetical protein BV22DRAFT_135413 [Leucogyrophana mollusca]